MTVDKETMKEIEQTSGKSVDELMEAAGRACAAFITEHFPFEKSVLILAGKGNNGGDGYVMADILKDTMDVRVVAVHGKPVTESALKAYEKLPSEMLVKYSDEEADHADLIIDAVYGFGFHGVLDSDTRSLFRKLNAYRDRIISIDINSGCECDSGRCDRDALASSITLALECPKPFHMLRKEHGMFDAYAVLDMGLAHNVETRYYDMDEEKFFSLFPSKKINAHKGTDGKTLVISGSYGMAGAAALNIMGAQSVGASYLMAGMHDSIYPVIASKFTTPVMLAFNAENFEEILTPSIQEAKAIACGSGWNRLDCKSRVLDLILQNAQCPVVLDAEALRMLVHNLYLLRFVKAPLIITPHIGEFSALIDKPAAYISEHREECAAAFAKEHHLYVVLKGANTIVASPDGRVYINQSGCQALAQAGSGDLLAGMMAGLLTIQKDIFTSVCMAVWFHGYLSEYGLKHHSIRAFPLESYPKLADEVLRKHNL